VEKPSAVHRRSRNRLICIAVVVFRDSPVTDGHSCDEPRQVLSFDFGSAAPEPASETEAPAVSTMKTTTHTERNLEFNIPKVARK
jgi:hypothetical protein